MSECEAEAELLKQACQGNEAAFLVLYERHRTCIFRFAYRMLGSAALAEDIVHDCFQLSPIYSLQSGAPIGFANDLIFYGNGYNDIALPSDQRTVTRWFNTDLFERIQRITSITTCAHSR